MAKTIDACGLTCPAPVLLVKDTVEQNVGEELIVLLDNEASKENVTRFLGSRGYVVSEKKQGDNFQLMASLDGVSPVEIEETEAISSHSEGRKKLLILVMVDRLGRGDDTLGEKLMINYLKTLKEMGPDLWQLIFVNGGVKLTTSSSPVIEELKAYEEAGVLILACGTCLEHFGILSEKAVGTTTNMLDIVTATQLADKVITIS